jgi:Gpi18-like mannosyltransferase
VSTSRARIALGAVIAIGTLARLWVTPAPGYPDDVNVFAYWAERIASVGPGTFYEPGVFADYPPGLLYVFWPLGALLDGERLRLAIKTLSVPADVALAVMLAAIVWRAAGPGRAVLAAGLWSLAPGAILAGAYWGQVDAITVLVALSAVFAAASRRWPAAGALGGLATIMKFQLGVILFVIIVAAIIEAMRRGLWRPLLALPAAAAVALGVALPFRLGPLELWALFQSARNEYQYTTLNAFNIWTVLAPQGTPDQGYVLIGGALLGFGIVASCVPLWWRRDTAALLAAGAFAALAFYFLPTRVHERYLFPALALLIPFAATRARVLVPYLGLAIAYPLTLYFALLHLRLTGVTAPRWIASTLFSRPGQIDLALFMIACAAAVAILLATIDRSLVPSGLGEIPPRLRRIGALLLPRLVALRARVLTRAEAAPVHGRRAQQAVLATLLVVPIAFNAIALLPEVMVPLPSNNDDAVHFLYVQRADEAISRGEDPLDFWAPEMEFGFAPFVHYQNLPHLAVVVLHRLTFGVVDLLTLFNLVRYALLVGLPLTVWWSLRRMGAPAPAAAMAGAAAGLLSGAGRFGIEYESFVWRGWGMYTQLWGAHLAFLALAALYELLHGGRGLIRAVLVVSALVLSHLIYAYMTAITVVVLFFFGLDRTNLRDRLVRLSVTAVAVALITSYMWLPFLLDRAYLDVTQPYLPRWRFDSFGIGPIVSWLATGDLLDHGRWPVLTLLLVTGIVTTLVRRDRLSLLGLVLLIVWVVLWSGRATLGPLADLLPLAKGMPVHRFVGGVDIAAIILIGLGAAALWRLAGADADPRRAAIVGVAFLLLLVPAMAERASYLAPNTTWMQQTWRAIQADRDAAALVRAVQALPFARVYAGANDAWLGKLSFVSFKSADLGDLLNVARVPRVAKPYVSLSLNSGLAFHFNDQDAAQYDVFNARYVIAAADQSVPAELRPLQRFGRYALYETPTTGWATLAASTTRESATSDERLFDRLRDWLGGDGPRARRFIRFDYPARSDAIGATTEWCANGRTKDELAQRDRLDVLVECDSAATVVLKMTYHPNWQVLVDGRPVEAFMVSPGFIGLEVPAGRHSISARYVSTPLKTPLLLLGGATAAALILRRRIRIPSLALLGRRPRLAPAALALYRRMRASSLDLRALPVTVIPARMGTVVLSTWAARREVVRVELVAVAITFVAALAIRVPGLGLPLIEWHGWRQTHTAFTALLYHEGGIDLFRPQVPIFGPPFVLPIEFPLFEAVAALVMDAGVAPDLAMRLTTLATFVVAAFLLWGLMRRMAGALAAFAALCFFLFLPLNLLFSRASLIEYLAVAGALGWLWAGIAWRDRPQSGVLYAISMLAGVVGMLTKAATPVFWVVPLVLYRSRHEQPGVAGWLRARLDARHVALVAVPVLIAFIWQAYADAIKGQQEATVYLVSTGAWLRHFYYSDLAERLDPALWGRIWDWVSRLVVGLGFLPLLPIGLWAAAHTRHRAFWYGTVLAAVLPVLVFFGAYWKHDYYFTAVTVQPAALMGLGVAWLAARARTFAHRGGLVAAIGAAALAVVFTSSDYRQRAFPPLDDFDHVLPRAQELAQLSRPDDLVVVIGRMSNPDLAYYSGRKAMMISNENQTEHLLSQLPQQGYRRLFSWDPAKDDIAITRRWTWSGPIGPRTYALGATPAAVGDAGVLTSDDVALYDRTARSASALSAAPLTIACDGAGHQVPAGTTGTWLRVRPAPGARMSLTPRLAPVPARGLIVVTPQITFGYPYVWLSCTGARQIVVEGVLDAPAPP